MIVESIKSLLVRDLGKLKKEISQYSNEANLWVVDREIKNSGGNLCYHLIGNLNHFIGAQLGGTGFVRQRDLEFSSNNIPKEQLLSEIDATIGIVENALSNLSDIDLDKDYPLIVFKEKMSIGFFLIHLNTHLTYHLGQINYHRRLLDF